MIRRNGLQAWMLASRPKTLTAAAAPVLIGGAYALWQQGLGRYADFSEIWSKVDIAFYLCFAFAMLMQINANFINDYFDFKKGADRKDRLGPERACAQGWVTEKAMKTAIVITSLLSCAVGFPLVFIGGYWLVIVGAVCVMAAGLYTTKLSYKGWGDVMVLVFFGFVPVVFTYYCMTLTIDLWIFLLGLATGLVIDDLLMINNYRDRRQDEVSGKKTIVVRLGQKAGLQLYWYVGSFGAVVSYIVLWAKNDPWCLLLVVYLVFHFMTFKKMRKIDGKALNAILGETSRNIVIFTIVTCAGLLIH
ncbi:MAG: 1,4-dihydroxy-2-naphthoate octaprenyltransferase [Bacteroidaceae bacterium]|nr:1,4-dihydroxy-2-naphthoate octaprenyltransferase [Bacteroidaceae bacterium]